MHTPARWVGKVGLLVGRYYQHSGPHHHTNSPTHLLLSLLRVSVLQVVSIQPAGEVCRGSMVEHCEAVVDTRCPGFKIMCISGRKEWESLTGRG